MRRHRQGAARRRRADHLRWRNPLRAWRFRGSAPDGQHHERQPRW